MKEIKWIRLRKIVEEITGCQVYIYLGEMLSEERAYVQRDGPIVEMILNLLYSKTLDDVIESIAHETLHVIKNTAQHYNGWEKDMKELENKIRQKYNQMEGGESGNQNLQG